MESNIKNLSDKLREYARYDDPISAAVDFLGVKYYRDSKNNKEASLLHKIADLIDKEIDYD